MVLTVSFVLSSVTMLGCHRHQWNRFHQLSACIGAPGPHDFAVRTNTARRAIIALGDVRPSHPIPNVRDDREPPLLWERDESKEATDLGVRSMRETATDWHDGQITLMRHALLHHTTARHSGACASRIGAASSQEFVGWAKAHSAVPTISCSVANGGHAEPVIGRAFARPVGFAHSTTTASSRRSNEDGRFDQSPLGGASGCTISWNGGSASQRAACAASAG